MKHRRRREKKKAEPIFKPRYLPLVVMAVFAGFVLKSAWLSDDAYITFRTVDNLVSGHGLVYNVGERVQSYTHPLWMLLLSLISFASRELYYTTIFFSVLVTLGTVYLFFKRVTVPAAILGIAILLGSKAFIDYSTSGLENPLSHLLMVLFLYQFFDPADDTKPLRLSLIAALAALTRLDTLLFYLPALVLGARRTGWRKSLPSVVIGFSPLIAWTLFSLVYYGAPVANPAYSKLATGIGGWELARQGSFYYLNSLRMDPLTLLAIVAGCVIAVMKRRPKELAVAIGIGLYLAYVFRVGGDFMSGRFFTIPLVAAAVLVARAAVDLRRSRLIVGYVSIAVLSLVSATNHLFSGPNYGDVPLVNTPHFGPLPLSLIDDHGVSDERAFYYQATGLLRPGGGGQPDHQWVRQGLDLSRRGAGVEQAYTLGFVGFFAGRDVHIIDPNGLNDFLIARLPVPSNLPWRIGHFTRKIPEGYTESVSTGGNVIKDPGLARYYEVVRLITRDELFAKGRLAAIWRSNTGAYNHLIRNYARTSEK